MDDGSGPQVGIGYIPDNGLLGPSL